MFPGMAGTPPHGAGQSESRPCPCIGLSLQLSPCTPLGADRATTSNLVMHINDQFYSYMEDVTNIPV